MIKSVQVLTCVSFAAVAACAAQPYDTSQAMGQSMARQCFLANEVRGFSAGGDGFYNLQVGRDRWFGMHLSSDCPDMNWLMQIAVRPRDSNWLCEGRNSFLIAPDPAGFHPGCFVSDIRPLSPDEIRTAHLRPLTPVSAPLQTGATQSGGLM
jgi:hypothetical protein